jgi:hypothetical protein
MLAQGLSLSKPEQPLAHVIPEVVEVGRDGVGATPVDTSVCAVSSKCIGRGMDATNSTTQQAHATDHSNIHRKTQDVADWQACTGPAVDLKSIL